MKAQDHFPVSPNGTMMPLILCFSAALLISNCTKSTDPNSLPRIELTAENVISREVWLKLRFVNLPKPWEFVVERDGREILFGRTDKPDTLIIDTTATPRTTYRYKAIQLEGKVKTLESDGLQVTTLDTTSHAVQWIVDTLGVRGEIYDVWAFSRDNIWAVGEMFLKDSTGNVDPVRYNAARFDGVRWKPMRIPTRSVGGSVGAAMLRSIFCFSPSDVWVFAYHGAYSHWNGSQWETQLGTGGESKLWGTSSSNLIVVGSNGAISRYDGTRWQKMDSGTEVDLEDVWGIDEKHVWATGTNFRDGRCVILQYDGRNWKTIYGNLGKPQESYFGFSSLWTNSEGLLWLTGNSRTTILNLQDGRFRGLPRSGSFVRYQIRATSVNDVFQIGQRGEVSHYNGLSWYLYPEIKDLASGSSYWYAAHVQQKLVVIGGYFFTGLYGVPVVLRGYR